MSPTLRRVASNPFGDPAQENLTLLLLDAHRMLTAEAAVLQTYQAFVKLFRDAFPEEAAQADATGWPHPGYTQPACGLDVAHFPAVFATDQTLNKRNQYSRSTSVSSAFLPCRPAFFKAFLPPALNSFAWLVSRAGDYALRMRIRTTILNRNARVIFFETNRTAVAFNIPKRQLQDIESGVRVLTQ